YTTAGVRVAGACPQVLRMVRVTLGSEDALANEGSPRRPAALDRRARATVLRARRTVLRGPTQSVPTYAATGRRPTRAAAKTCPAVSDGLLYAGSPCLPAEPARGDLIAASPITARRESSRCRSHDGCTERQHRNPNEHLASGHRPPLLRLVRPLAYHLTPLTAAPATRRLGTRTFGRARRSLAPR